MAHSILDVQKALDKRGYDPGPLDGVYGRRTAKAVEDFQRGHVFGIKYYGTIGPKTLAALFPGEDDAPPTVEISYPWFDLALRKKGLHEDRDNAELRKFLKTDGHTLGDPSKLPWCGDFVETCIAVTLPHEFLPDNPYLARNWLKFGVDTQPTLAAVAVFWRGSRDGTSGHVAFMAGEEKEFYYILGGNQSDSVSLMKIGKTRLLGCRWPKTSEKSSIHLPKMQGGKLSLNEA